MTKQEIYDKILTITAEVCNVSEGDIRTGSRRHDVVIARSICIFWAGNAGFCVECLLACSDKENHNSVDSIKAKIEEYWIEHFAYHMLVTEVGKRLLEYANSIGEDFDMYKPIRRIAYITGKYMPGKIGVSVSASTFT